MDRATFERLTATQLAVLWLIADHSRGAVATKLGMGSVETVKTHLARIRERLGISDTAAASRVLRTLIRCPPPWVNPPWGMEPDPAPSHVTMAVREEVQPFHGFPPSTAPIVEPRFAALGAADRIRLMAASTLKLALFILVGLAILEALTRITRAYWDGNPAN